MEAFSAGVVLTAYYKTAKNNTTHEKENIAIALSFGKNKAGKIPDDKRIMMMCSEQNQTQFMSFAADRAGGTVALPEN